MKVRGRLTELPQDCVIVLVDDDGSERKASGIREVSVTAKYGEITTVNMTVELSALFDFSGVAHFYLTDPKSGEFVEVEGYVLKGGEVVKFGEVRREEKW